jgi:hypothetical protein
MFTVKTLGFFYTPPHLEPSSSVDKTKVGAHWWKSWMLSAFQAAPHLYCAWAWIRSFTLRPRSSQLCWGLFDVLLVLSKSKVNFLQGLDCYLLLLLFWCCWVFCFVFFRFFLLITLLILWEFHAMCFDCISPGTSPPAPRSPELLEPTFFTLNYLVTSGFPFSFCPGHWVTLVLSNYSWEWGLTWSVVTILGVISLKTTNFLSPSSYQMAIASQPMWEFHATPMLGFCLA